MKESSERKVNFKIALIGLVVVVTVLFLVGLFINRPEPMVIQGEAEATEVRVSGKIPGRIHKFYGEEGQNIKKGDTLVVVESPELTAKLGQATAAKEAADAQNQKAKKGSRKEQKEGAFQMWQKALVGVDIAQKSYGRVQTLFEKGVITAQKRDEAKAQYDAALATAQAAKSQYDMALAGAEIEDKMMAQANVNRASGAIEEVESYINETILVSPIDGQISEIYPKRGELVGSGAPIMSIIDLNDMWFTFNVREDMLGAMKTGATMEVSVPALDGKTFDVRVTHIKVLASYATWKPTSSNGDYDAKTFEVKAKPISQVEGLLPGMSAIVNKVK